MIKAPLTHDVLESIKDNTQMEKLVTLALFAINQLELRLINYSDRIDELELAINTHKNSFKAEDVCKDCRDLKLWKTTQ